MTENDALSRLVEGYKQSKAPVSQWVGRSLEEIYLESGWSWMRVEGNRDPDLKYSPQFLRIIALRNDRVFRGISLAMLPTTPRRELIDGANRLRQKTRDLVGTELPYSVVVLAAQSLIQENKQAAAALELSIDQENRPLVQVLYPKRFMTVAQGIFGSIGMRLGESELRNAAAALSINLLKTTPYPKTDPIPLIPENLE